MLTGPRFHRGYYLLGLSPPSHVLPLAAGASGSGAGASARPASGALERRWTRQADAASQAAKGKRKPPGADPGASKRSRLSAKEQGVRGCAAAVPSPTSSSSEGPSEEEREEEEEREDVACPNITEVSGAAKARVSAGTLPGKAGRDAPVRVQVADAMSSPPRGDEDLSAPPPTKSPGGTPSLGLRLRSACCF